MKNVKIISTILFYITRIAAILYIFTAAYSLVSMLTGWGYITESNGEYFIVRYPFTEMRFLLGENTLDYKIFYFLIPIASYGFFFYLLSNVFNIFKQTKLFTIYGISRLKWFWIANIFGPTLICFLTSAFVDNVDEGMGWAMVIHFFLGVFAYFLYAIFRQGVNLQNEQDLYI